MTSEVTRDSRRGAWVIAVSIAILSAGAAGCRTAGGLDQGGGACVASQSAPGVEVVWSQESRFARDPRVDSAKGDLRRGFEGGVRLVRDRLGDGATHIPFFTIEVVDCLGFSEFEVMGAAFSEYSRSDKGHQGRIVIFAEPLLSGMLDLEKVFRHELVHLAFAACGGENMVPDWIVEGGALWFEADRVPDRIDHILKYSILEGKTRREPIKALLASELAMETALPEGRAVAGLVVFSCLELRSSRTTVDHILSRVLCGEDWRAIVHEESGGELSPDLTTILGQYREWMANECEGAPDLQRASVLANTGDSGSAINVLSGISSRDPDSPLMPWVLRCEWDIYLGAGNWREARRCVDSFLARYPRHSLAYDAKTARAEIGLKEGLAGEAKAEARILLSEILWAPWHAVLKKRAQRVLDSVEGG